MKKSALISLLLCVVSFTFVTATEKIKVACVGNSITFGAGIVNREANSYPAQLQTYLGDDYLVENFGVGGTTALFKGGHSYVNTTEYKASLEFAPDIIFLKLGTNDSNDRHTEHFEGYKSDYQAIIDSYKNLESKPRIILITPVRCYLPDESGLSDARIVKQVAPIVKELAYENDLEIFDGYSLFGSEYNGVLMPDRLHPSSIGAGIMTQNFHRLLASERDDDFDIFDELDGGKDFNFHGFKGREYSQYGLTFKVVQPKVANEKHSWVLRARFWGHEPQLDRRLLELGFHVTYCEVGNLFGSPDAVNRWDIFYKLMTDAGLNKKVVLEGMSRGGLIAYNWAVQNPKKVSAIYADAPVLDLKSWPMGEGIYRGSDVDVKQMLSAYGMTSRDEMLEFEGNPIDHAQKLAKAKIPILHVVGGADIIVPVVENTDILVARIEAEGGKIEVINKEKVGHHPHSLSAPEPIVQFILRAEGLYENVCVKPVRGNEFRPGAGWYGGADWNQTATDITTTLKEKEVDILMLGNSITQGFAVNRKLVGSCKNNKAFNEIFNGYNWESAGISGDRTQHLLWRIQNGEYNSAHPKYVTIAIGVNNADDDAESVYEGIVAVTEAALVEFPDSRIILFGMLPTAASETRFNNFNEIIDRLETTKFDKRVMFVDPRERFTDENGELHKHLYSGDMIHITSMGYVTWAELIMESIDAILANEKQ